MKTPPSALIYDCEIIRCIPDRSPRDESLDYCGGWHDHANMGISVIGVYDYVEDAYRVFCHDNLHEFAALVKAREEIAGFNSVFFDDLLCRAHGIEIQTTYDLLVHVRRGTGQPDCFVWGQTKSGYRLEDLARANLGTGKSGDGALAPVLWQKGRIGSVIDYCLRDVAITRRLIEMRGLIDPNNGTPIYLPYLGKEGRI